MSIAQKNETIIIPRSNVRNNCEKLGFNKIGLSSKQYFLNSGIKKNIKKDAAKNFVAGGES